MQSTTGPVGGSRARVIYHAPGKSFAWLHKDGSFAELQKALRVRLNIPKNDPLVIKQIDGDYTLDIETEEEYEAFCHLAKSASQLYISINGGLRDQSKAGEVAVNSSSTNFPAALPLSTVPQPPPESEDLALGKRKASQITTDPVTVPTVTQKRKKRRKVGPNQSISTANNPSITGEPPQPEAELGVVLEDVTRNAPSINAVASADQLTVSRTQKKQAGAGQRDPASADPAEQCVAPSAELTGAPEPPSTEPSKTKKRKKTVVLDLSTVIPSPGAAQLPSTSTARPPSPVAEPSPSTTEVTKKPPAKKKTKTPVASLEPTPATPPVPRQKVVDEYVPSGSITKQKPPVSKSGLPRPEVYVEIITKKRKTGETDGSNVAEKETKQQEPVKKLAQPKVGKPKGNPKKSKISEAAKQVDPNAPSIQEIMDGVIAAAVEDAKKRASSASGGTTTDVSENFTPPPQIRPESMVRKPRLGDLADVSSLGAASSATLLDTAPTTVDSDSVAARKKVRTRKSRAEASPFLRDSDSSSLVSNVHHGLDGNSTVLMTLFKNGNKPNTLLAAPPPNQKATKNPLIAETQPGEESTSSEDENPTPKKKLVPVSNPDDELDAFLHAPTHQSQRSILEELPSSSEDEEEEVEREDMEVDDEDEALKSKLSGHGQLRVIARAGSSPDDDSKSESVATDALVKANQVNINTQVTHVSETQDTIPSSDLEDGELLPQPTKSTSTSTTVVPRASSTSDSSEPHMAPISKLRSAGQAFSFFNERILDKPDPIDNDSSHVAPPNDSPEDTEDPIENADTTSTPKPGLAQRTRSRNKTAGPVVARKSAAGSKATQSSLTSPQNSMPPPLTTSRDIKGDLTFDQPLGQSTPAAPNVSRKKRLASQTTVPETPARSTWTTLPQTEQSTQSMDDRVMVDELISSPTESAAKPPKATPMKKPTSLGSTKQTPLFLPGTSQYPIPSSDLPAPEESSSEESEESEEEKAIVPPLSRVLRSSTKNKTTTPYRSLSVLASQRSIFPPTPIEPARLTPINKSQTKPGSEDDDDDDGEDSGVSDSDSDSPPHSHIPKGRRAGAGNGSRVTRRSQLAMFS